jgi:hypothetical protein
MDLLYLTKEDNIAAFWQWTRQYLKLTFDIASASKIET